MTNYAFNKLHIEQLTDEGLRSLIQALWMWKAKQGIKIVQNAINNLGSNIAVDGWLGDKSIEEIKKYGGVRIHGAIANEISNLSEVKDPPWITIARKELGVKEIKGRKHNKRVIKYHSTTYGKYKNDEVPWCGSFVNWVMLESGITETVKFPERAKSWKNFGVIIDKPTHGCIAIKSRMGGGHVCFVVGKSKKGKYLYCLGGNQGDAVTIRKYRADAFSDFRLPMHSRKIALSTYKSSAASSGSEA